MDLTEEFKVIQDRVDKLQEQANSIVAPIKKLEEYIEPDSKHYLWGCHRRGYDSNVQKFFDSGTGLESVVTEGVLNTVLNIFDKTLQQWKEDNKEIRVRNQEVIKHNKLQKERIVNIMEMIGIPKESTAWSYKTARSRKLTPTRYIAGYVKDLDDNIITHDPYDIRVRQIERKRENIEAYGKKRVEEQKKAIQKKNLGEGSSYKRE